MVRTRKKEREVLFELGKNDKKKSCIKKLLQENGKECIDSNIILNEIYNLYSDLYDEKGGIEINESTCPFVGNHSFIPKLNDEQRDLCEGQLTYAECYKVLSTFENNKTPENDRLTYNKIGTLLVDSLNYAYFYGELSNTQKQAVITLIKKKGKDGIDQNLETNISPKR